MNAAASCPQPVKDNMRIIRSKDLQFIPANHEDPNNPGVLKRVLFRKDDLIKGRIQMINWAKLLTGRSFEKHYHEDMLEVFIILNGKVKIIVDNEEDYLEKGDAVLIPVKAVHQMINKSQEDIDYIALGISTNDSGKTVKA